MLIRLLMGVLNNTNFQEHIDLQARCILEASGRFKKAWPEPFEGFVPQGRSHFCEQSVLPVREHGKMARTPLAAFFNSPLIIYCSKCMNSLCIQMEMVIDNWRSRSKYVWPFRPCTVTKKLFNEILTLLQKLT